MSIDAMHDLIEPIVESSRGTAFKFAFHGVGSLEKMLRVYVRSFGDWDIVEMAAARFLLKTEGDRKHMLETWGTTEITKDMVYLMLLGQTVSVVVVSMGVVTCRWSPACMIVLCVRMVMQNTVIAACEGIDIPMLHIGAPALLIFRALHYVSSFKADALHQGAQHMALAALTVAEALHNNLPRDQLAELVDAVDGMLRAAHSVELMFYENKTSVCNVETCYFGLHRAYDKYKSMIGADIPDIEVPGQTIFDKGFICDCIQRARTLAELLSDEAHRADLLERVERLQGLVDEQCAIVKKALGIYKALPEIKGPPTYKLLRRVYMMAYETWRFDGFMVLGSQCKRYGLVDIVRGVNAWHVVEDVSRQIVVMRSNIQDTSEKRTSMRWHIVLRKLTAVDIGIHVVTSAVDKVDVIAKCMGAKTVKRDPARFMDHLASWMTLKARDRAARAQADALVRAEEEELARQAQRKAMKEQRTKAARSKKAFRASTQRAERLRVEQERAAAAKAHAQAMDQARKDVAHQASTSRAAYEEALERRRLELDNVEEEVEDEFQEEECVVCMERAPEVRNLPCGHVVMCEQCASSVKEATGSCPLCRSSFFTFVIV